MFRAHPILSSALFVYLGALAFLTLTPAGNVDAASSAIMRLAQSLEAVRGWEWVDFAVLEITANIALFVPMGVLVLLLLGRERWWVVIAVGVIASSWIELAQGVWLPSRVADTVDLASNSIGTAVGVVLVFALVRPRRLGRVIGRRTARQAGA